MMVWAVENDGGMDVSHSADCDWPYFYNLSM